MHETSKNTTLLIALTVTQTYTTNKIKAPWFIDLLNINLNNEDLDEAGMRVKKYMDAFIKDGVRITENVDFE